MTDETRAHLIAMGKGKQVETYDKVLERYRKLKANGRKTATEWLTANSILSHTNFKP